MLHFIPKSGCFLLPKMPGADFSFFHLTPRNSILSNISGLGWSAFWEKSFPMSLPLMMPFIPLFNCGNYMLRFFFLWSFFSEKKNLSVSKSPVSAPNLENVATTNVIQSSPYSPQWDRRGDAYPVQRFPLVRLLPRWRSDMLSQTNLKWDNPLAR